MEESNFSQEDPSDKELYYEDTEDSVEFLVEVRTPCLICGVDVEIDNIVKQEIYEIDEWAGSTEVDQLDMSDMSDGTLDHHIFHWFLRWFRVEIVKMGKHRFISRAWDGEGGDILRFCVNCKKELMRILKLQKQLDELEQKIKNGLDGVKGKMERFEEAFQINKIYDKDQRYKVVRSWILKSSKNPTQDHTQSSSKQSVDQSSCGKLPIIQSNRNPDVTLIGEAALISIAPARISSAKITKKVIQKSVNMKKQLDQIDRRKGISQKQFQVAAKPVKKKVRTRKLSQPIKSAVELYKPGSRPQRNRIKVSYAECNFDDDDKYSQSNSLSSENNSEDLGLLDNHISHHKAQPIFQRKSSDLNASKPKDNFVNTAIKKKFPCKICERPIWNSRNHEWTHMNKVEQDNILQTEPNRIPDWFRKKMVCGKCGKSFRQRRELLKHMETRHEGKPNDSCPQCGKAVVSLWQHIKYNHRPTQRKFECTEEGCGKRFKTTSELTRHKNYVHRKVQLGKCTICSKAFVSKDGFKRHMDLHMGLRPWKCGVNGCGAAFGTKSILKKHHNSYHEEGHNSKRKLTTKVEPFAEFKTGAKGISSQRVLRIKGQREVKM